MEHCSGHSLASALWVHGSGVLGQARLVRSGECDHPLSSVQSELSSVNSQHWHQAHQDLRLISQTERNINRVRVIDNLDRKKEKRTPRAQDGLHF